LAVLLVLIGVAGAGLAHAATSAKAPEKAQAKTAMPLWAQRCEKGTKYCEVFQQLSIKKKDGKAAQRLIEFAVGYPPDKKGQARGVFILPLGTLLIQDTVVSIDGKAAFTFRVRYCDASGCVAVLDLPDATMAAIRKGKQMTVKLAAQNGQEIDINMQLEGFGAALDKVKG
jgi:invasion protein IalB